MGAGRVSVRLMLCAVVIVAMGLAGTRIGDGYRRRERLLDELIRSLKRLEEQMLLRHRPLGEALRQADMPLLSKLADATEANGAEAAWTDFCSRESGPEGRLAAMEPPERAVMDVFWSDLGLLSRGEQQNRFSEAQEALRQLFGQARESSAKRARLFGTLGVLLGMIVVVILW